MIDRENPTLNNNNKKKTSLGRPKKKLFELKSLVDKDPPFNLGLSLCTQRRDTSLSFFDKHVLSLNHSASLVC